MFLSIMNSSLQILTNLIVGDNNDTELYVGSLQKLINVIQANFTLTFRR